jgi:hypothetical protein
VPSDVPENNKSFGTGNTPAPGSKAIRVASGCPADGVTSLIVTLEELPPPQAVSIAMELANSNLSIFIILALSIFIPYTSLLPLKTGN